ncbi:hypothetical protein [Agaribacter marinus]|uniref:Uncharacterized protein n=1 Tax=Agaribacter marinus TaxID=1431249 RepID=A0AA37WHE7_9ALTE|nr:hypothetical protein [Agaribacter marinus]GLR71026.1 hypothetical protein GCM10007852_19340 [Agaribacter marinus]
MYKQNYFFITRLMRFVLLGVMLSALIAGARAVASVDETVQQEAKTAEQLLTSETIARRNA